MVVKAHTTTDSDNFRLRTTKLNALRAWVHRAGAHAIPFTLLLPGVEPIHSQGSSASRFQLVIGSERAARAILSESEHAIADAYVAGELDVSGAMYDVLSLRDVLHGEWKLTSLRHLLGPILLGQSRSDRAAIRTHYEFPDEFYLSFMDKSRTYSHGVFCSDEDPLSLAMENKLNFVIRACNLEPGARVLDVGGGWGAFTEFAGIRGINVTSLTIADRSREFIAGRINELQLPCCVHYENFLEHESREQYDAVVILGVLEHIPNYKRAMKKVRSLLKDGGMVYIDGSASESRYAFNRFFKKHIYPGDHRPIHLLSVLQSASENDLETVEVINDRKSYYLTTAAWARRFEARRAEIEREFGGPLFRKFQLYLWGVCRAFADNRLQAYRIILRKSSLHNLGSKRSNQCVQSANNDG